MLFWFLQQVLVCDDLQSSAVIRISAQKAATTRVSSISPVSNHDMLCGMFTTHLKMEELRPLQLIPRNNKYPAKTAC